MTIHLEAKQGDYAETVLLPGDPLRAKWISETFLSDATCVNTVRGMYGYTGWYNGRRVSVQGSGMGHASLGIYVHELYTVYDVGNIIRIGSCGGIGWGVQKGDIVVALSACTDSNMTNNLVPGFTINPAADFDLARKFVDTIGRENVHVGTIVSSDYFYQPNSNWWRSFANLNVLGVDMETHALYSLALRFNKKALTVNTVSEHLHHPADGMSSQEREQGLAKMIENVLSSLS